MNTATNTNTNTINTITKFGKKYQTVLVKTGFSNYLAWVVEGKFDSSLLEEQMIMLKKRFSGSCPSGDTFNCQGFQREVLKLLGGEGDFTSLEGYVALSRSGSHSEVTGACANLIAFLPRDIAFRSE